MTQIIYYPHRDVAWKGDEGTLLSHIRAKALRKKRELCISSNTDSGYRVFASYDNSSIIIYEKAEVVAEVNGFEIAIRNQYIKRFYDNWKPSGHWKQNGDILFKFYSNKIGRVYELKNGISSVITENYEPSFISSVINFIKREKPKDKCIRIDFHMGTFDHLLALCILSTHIWEFLNSD